jgi:predicted TIM-barrel fold metal-dependent hydrolase
MTRRQFLAALAAQAGPGAGPVIDIHQHTNYSGRTDDRLIAHQQIMGITKTVLLPAGRKYGLAAGAGGNETVLRIARERPVEYSFFANELPDIPETRQEIEKYLNLGAIGIGEQKFDLACDSAPMQLIYSIAQEYNVPVLMHFQHGAYNHGIERFHKMLEKYPKVNFIGHAQTWWGNVDKNHDQKVMYPKTPVAPGGITDRLLRDYPNMYGDLSAGSGLNALRRDEEQARAFLSRHQDKLLYGSDCSDPVGEGEKCSGSQQIATLLRLAPDAGAVRKILYGNAARVLRIR